MSADAKWLDLLKANGWQFGCLAAAAWIVVFADKAGLLPVALDATFKQATMLAAFALTALWVASIASSASNWSQAPIAMVKDRFDRRAHAKAVRDYIPYMTEEERAVVAQLLHENRKSFTGENDGAAEAIAMMEANPEIRVVFTDIQMPGTMDGLALSHYVRKRWPPTMIIVSSGIAHRRKTRWRVVRASYLNPTFHRRFSACCTTSGSSSVDPAYFLKHTLAGKFRRWPVGSP